MRLSIVLLAAASVVLAGATARADLPPPDGEKFVDYTFSVRGLSLAPDRVLLAFPCTESSGAPRLGHEKLVDGRSVRVGRRGGTCALRHASKADYEAFIATYKETQSFQDPPLEAFMKATLPCEGGPTIRTQIAKADPRTVVEERLAVQALSATACKVGPDTPSGPKAGAPPESPSSPAPPPVKRGCSAAPEAPLAASPEAALAACVVAAVLLVARRRRHAA